MYKIDKLDIKYFKFFVDTEPLNFESKNILVFGENGSGKSTIYWALYTLLQSSFKSDEKVKNYFTQSSRENPNDKSLVNIYENDDSKSYVKLSLKDPQNNDKNFTISKDLVETNKEDYIVSNANLASDFINYKYLFRFFNFLHKEEIDLFSLFEYEILHFLNKDDTNLYELWNTVLQLEKDKPRVRGESTNYKKVVKDLKKFNELLKLFIEDINIPANQYLQKFGYADIKLKLTLGEGTYQKQIFDKPKIKLSITAIKDGGDEPILKPQSYFNEAKLTALALSVRLAISQIKLKDSELKVLVLDDLLVSLDMSNRDIVLNILLDDLNFKDFQFIIFTHDRTFFERSKQIFDYKQRGKWKYFEMYMDKKFKAPKFNFSTENEGSSLRNNQIKFHNNYIEVPFIREPNADYLEEAKEYFKKKRYPPTANYLRKDFERKLDSFLKLDNLDEKIKLAKFKENVVWIRKLGKNIKKTLSALESFENCEKASSPDDVALCVEFSKNIKTSIESLLEYIDNDFHFEEFEDVKLILKSILHPQSHDDVTKPLYKKELEDAIELMEAFKAIVDGRDGA